jgi:hypothetical protein
MSDLFDMAGMDLPGYLGKTTPSGEAEVVEEKQEEEESE